MIFRREKKNEKKYVFIIIIIFFKTFSYDCLYVNTSIRVSRRD